ncbi:hypothetical protein K3495_g5915 [Podosphaera aphanis]|nr:hypothetical protein K3495_g5915 [Podosphaera aphanis]
MPRHNCFRALGIVPRPLFFITAPAASSAVRSQRNMTSFCGPSRPRLSASSSPQFLNAPRSSSPDVQTLDLAAVISSHPALSATQIRCGPRNTFSPSHFVRKRRHGFLSRIKTRKGRMTLARRKAKKRTTLSH